MSPATSTVMSTGVGALLADGVRRDPAERRRSRLLTAAVAGSGAFLLAALAVMTIPFSRERSPLDPRLPDLAPFLAERGLRPGVAFGAVLLVLPFAAFAAQALRVGTAARERRLAALRLAGATRGDLRRIAAVEGARSGFLGSLLVAPVYLALWLLLGVLLPPGTRMLPPLLGVQVRAWVALVPLLTAAGALAAARAVRAGTVDPVGGPRRRVRPLSTARLWFPVTVLAVMAGTALAAPALLTLSRTGWVLLVGLVLASVTAGPSLMVVAGRLAVRSPDLAWQLAGRRLLADPRTPGRAAGVLVAAGLVIGVVAVILGLVTGAEDRGTDLEGAVLGGFVAILLAAGFAIVVSTLSLLVGATEQVLDHRRPTAVLVALGADPVLVATVAERQVMAAAVLPATVGVLAGWVLWAVQWLTTSIAPPAAAHLSVLPALLLAGGTARLGARLVVRLLRGPLAEAASVENLRAP